MEENTEFQTKLSEALESYCTWLTSSELPRLHDLFRLQQTTLEAVHSLLMKKGVFREDPYKYEKKVSEIEAPSTQPFTESERNDVVGIRLSEYIMMLDFLNNSYQFSVDFLDLSRITRILSLLRTFNWKEIVVNSNSPNSRGLAEAVNAVRSGNDPLSTTVLTENISRVSKDVVVINQILGSLTQYHRENYKYLLREKCGDAVYATDSDKGTFLRAVKKAAATAFPREAFLPELAEELYAEIHSQHAQQLQDELLTKLTKTEPTKKEQKKEAIDMKAMLLDALRGLGGLGPQIDETVKKIEENKKLMDSRDTDFFTKLKKLLCQAFGIKEKPFIMDVEAKDPSNQRILRYSIAYVPFIDDLRRRGRLYSAFSIRTSGAYQKVEQSTEPQILKFLVQHIEEMQVILKKMQGLDAYFKAQVKPENGEKIYGLKVEIATMKNTLINANQKRFEYTSLIEEQQQMAKLGITNS